MFDGPDVDMHTNYLIVLVEEEERRGLIPGQGIMSTAIILILILLTSL